MMFIYSSLKREKQIVPYLSQIFGKQAWANSVDQDQMPQNAASDLGLHCLPLIQQYLDKS